MLQSSRCWRIWVYCSFCYGLPLTPLGSTCLCYFWEQLFRVLVGLFSWEKFITGLLAAKIQDFESAVGMRLKLLSWFMTFLLSTLDFLHSWLAHSDHNPWGILNPGQCFILRLWLFYLSIYHLNGENEFKLSTQLHHLTTKYSLPATHV